MVDPKLGGYGLLKNRSGVVDPSVLQLSVKRRPRSVRTVAECKVVSPRLSVLHQGTKWRPRSLRTAAECEMAFLVDQLRTAAEYEVASQIGQKCS